MTVLAIGLMSGTSADGIDAALVEMDGDAAKPSLKLVHALVEPYSEEERRQIFAAFSPDYEAHKLGRLNWDMGRWLARAVDHLLSEADVASEHVQIIGSHGQTIAHYPPVSSRDGMGYGLQIGEPAVIAQLTHIDVVSDFRAADMAVYGQGAPLIPYFDYALLRSKDEPRIVLNIGGIANITVLPTDVTPDSLVGFDTGPGNMVLDGLMEIISGGTRHFDQDGALAAQGTVQKPLLDRWMHHPYFSMKPPKSTGRELFGLAHCTQMAQEANGVSFPDLLRTASAWVAETIAQGIVSQMTEDFALIASGGGALNPVLMTELAARLPLVRPWESAAHYGIPSDYKEAIAFAFFAWLFAKGHATGLPHTTGAIRSVMQGSWTPYRPGTKLY